MTMMAPVAAALMILTACGGGGGDDSPAASGTTAAGEPQAGGEMTVLEDTAFTGSWPTGLDPATNTTGGANLPMMQSIYGGLFLLRSDDDGTNAAVEPNQAESGELSADGLTFTVKLRDGITFSDGTPMDAEAVKFNWERSLA